MDVSIINPFINATINLLETMAFVKSEAGKPYLKNDDIAQGDGSGIVGFLGDTNGTVAVTFDEVCILSLSQLQFKKESTNENIISFISGDTC